MRKAKSNRLFIIGGAISIFIFILLGSIFINKAYHDEENVIEYSNINRSDMHPLDSLRFKML
ncbi:MAG TPA: hypothetical protein DG753_01435 [Clostridium sp.]|nr:hypothetical protein [Clostridium sp.]